MAKNNLTNKSWISKIIRFPQENINRENFLRLDKNERVIDFEKKFKKFLINKINTYNISAYPDTYKIKKLIARKNRVSPDMIFLSAGSDLALKTCIELFTKPKNKIIILEPTFGMVNVYCNVYNLNAIKVGYNSKLELDYKKLFKNISKKISLLILANPNSPTGTIIKKDLMIEILNKCKKFKIPVVIDEAYEGFYNFSYAKVLKKYENLIITRTFSKSFGLAGLRAGYAISNKKISNLLNKYRPMYELNSIVCSAVEYLLKNYFIVRTHIKKIKEAKKFLKSELIKMNINFIDTYANFFHIEIKNKEKKKFEKELQKKGILIRKGPGVKGLEGYSRFSLGSKKQMKKIIQILKKK
jgi:histidinol-phosphate aminotransferase